MGRVGAPHGLRGALKVKAQSADPASLLDYDEWWVRTHAGATWVAYRVLAGREQAGMLVADLAGIASREAACALRGADVGVPRASLPALGDDEHYQADLIGMTVVNRNAETLGVVAEFAESGAHPILRIAGDDGRERLIPWVPQYIDGVDAAARRIEVDWPAND
ncbi:MAG: ribosome maturation factor RimM [Pseudomonadota bacterium]|nr:ribosome maturation factor RimM [Pseudomonadota bacterium]